jgi:carbonic anhydrase/acetyltransferase-like protein (isoleucine patch superfamily)
VIRGIGGKRPQLGKDVFVAGGAQVIGDVILGDHSSIWFNCVVRADVGTVRIGARSNLQDLSVIHVSGGEVSGKFDTTVGDDVSIGHRAVLHGCTVGDGALIGIGAVILDGAEVGANTIIGANALVTPHTRIPAGVLAIGAPARVIRDLTPEELKNRKPHAAVYVRLAARHRENQE